MESCPCGSNTQYEKCCGPIHENHSEAKSAKSLMQARYSAFVKNKVDFIEATNIPGTTDFNTQDAQEWAQTSTWDHLEVVSTKMGEESQSTGVVEFKAFYTDKNSKDIIHHEIAQFKKLDSLWYYTEGQIVGHEPIKRVGPKVGRNDPCICGSGKKFKKCCGKN